MASKLAAVILFAWLAASDARAQTSVRVMDFNIHRDVGGSDSNIASQPALAKVINFLAPDVLTLNEVGGNSVAFNATTARALLVSFIQNSVTIFGAAPKEGTDFYVYLSSLSDGFIANAIVSRYPILSSQTYSDAGGVYPALRGLTMALVDLPGPTDLGVFTAHLKAFNDNAAVAKRQAEATADSANVLSWMSAHPSAAAVLTGDWNESEDVGDPVNWSGHKIGDALSTGEGYRPITIMKSGLADAAPVSIAGDNDTIDSAVPDARFDYLTYSAAKLSLSSTLIFDTKQYSASQLTALNATSGTNFLAGDSTSASDHLPVFGVFQVVPEPGGMTLLMSGCAAMLSVRRRRR